MSPFFALIESTELPLNAPDILLICPELQAFIGTTSDMAARELNCESNAKR
jgi:hypothetical protein